MDYIFQIDHWTDERRIVATYIDADAPLGARDFEPITFSSQDLDAYPLEGFIVSRLDTLVALYTGSDPAKLLKNIACEHDEQEECDCSPVSIIIPRLLAYHAATLHGEIDNLSLHFEETRLRDGSTRRRYWLPDGQTITTFDNRGQGTRSDDWGRFDFLKWQHSNVIFNNWFAQGISLHKAWMASKRGGDEKIGF